MKTPWLIHSQQLQTQPSAEKTVTTVFWDLQRNLFVHYMPHKTAICCYALEIKGGHQGKTTRGILLLDDNNPLQKSRKAITVTSNRD